MTGFPNVFVRNNTDGLFQLVNSYAQAPSGVTPVAANEDGASADLSTVVFDETAQLTADASTSSDNLYMSNGGTVKLLGAGATPRRVGPRAPRRVRRRIADLLH